MFHWLEHDEKSRAKKVYTQILTLAIFAHSSYVVIFFFFSFWLPCLYNIASVLFYCLMLLAVQRNHLRLAVTAIHMEVCLFVGICTLLCGWEFGFSFYLIAISSLVYFCPYDHKYIPYLFSVLEIAEFVLLRFYTRNNLPYYPLPPSELTLWFYLYGAAACFAIILFAALFSNITAAVTNQRLREENKDLHVLANYDYLTQLLSRHAFFERLGQCRPGEPAAVAMGDIDDFKRVNDTYGHVCGDYVLRDVAQTMSSLCGDKAAIGRWGGEEFILLFPNRSREEAEALLQTICESISSRNFQYEQKPIHITITFGLCAGPASPDMQPFIDSADRRLYLAKSQGKNRVLGCDGMS